MTGPNNSDLATSFPILFSRRWRARGLDDALAALDVDALCTEYTALRERAPRRSLTGKPYFVGHTGVPSTTGRSNRLEEHCAIALFNLDRRWPRSDGGWFRLIDYQVPLKARQADADVGKIDLLGVTDRERLVIVELKVKTPSGGRGDAPPTALMEGLRYAAIVEANLEALAGEAERSFDTGIARIPPIVQLLAPAAWWRDWVSLPAAGDWRQAFARLAETLEARIGVTVECIALEDVEVSFGSDDRAPQFDHVPALYPVRLDGNPPIEEV